jgi:hypothetical protein
MVTCLGVEPRTYGCRYPRSKSSIGSADGRQVRPWNTFRGLPSARVSAARTVLELAIKGFELEDLAARVEESELQVAKV